MDLEGGLDDFTAPLPGGDGTGTAVLRVAFSRLVGPPQTLDTDPELIPWVYGIIEGSPSEAGDFLQDVAKVAVRADWENYVILRPALLALQARYPEYCWNGPRKGRAD